MNEESDFSAKLGSAIKAAERAAEISRHYYDGNFRVAMKEDRTPVTQADIECEEVIREIILEQYPDDGFYGEETGKTEGAGADLWLVDPIDGTKAFLRRYPFFSTQIALMRNHQLMLGVSCGTMFNEIILAERGKGAFLNGQRLAVSKIDDLSKATYSTGNLKSLSVSDGWARLGEIVSMSDRIRGYGDFYQYHLLAAGKISYADIHVNEEVAEKLSMTLPDNMGIVPYGEEGTMLYVIAKPSNQARGIFLSMQGSGGGL